MNLRRGDEPRVVSALKRAQGCGRNEQRRAEGGRRCDGLRDDFAAAAEHAQTLLYAAEVNERFAVANLIAELHQVGARDFVDVHVHHDFGALLVDALEKLADEAYVLGRVAHGYRVGRLVRGDDGLASGLRRNRSRDERAPVARANVAEIAGAPDELLILRTLDLLGAEDRSVRE